MKTLHSTPFFIFILMIWALSFSGCGDAEVEGCTNAFASNYNSSATLDCCCEFDTQALVEDLVGTYDFKFKNSDLTQGFSTTSLSLVKDPEDSNKFIIMDFWYDDMVATFENGRYTLYSEAQNFTGCSRQTTGTIINEGGTLIMDIDHRSWGINPPPSQFECNTFSSKENGELIKR